MSLEKKDQFPKTVENKNENENNREKLCYLVKGIGEHQVCYTKKEAGQLVKNLHVEGKVAQMTGPFHEVTDDNGKKKYIYKGI